MTRTRALAWVGLALVVAVSGAVLVARSEPDDSPSARARRIERELRCPACEGLSVADSFEATSRAIRADIEERIAAGESDAEIRQAYVDRFGEDILLRPSGDGLGMVAWGLPAAVLVLGAGGVVLTLRRWSRRTPERVTPARRALTAGALVVVAGAVAVLLAQSLGERRPGQTLTGNNPGVETTGEPGAVLRAAVDADPDDYDARMAYARFLLASDPAEALRQYDAAARIEPTEPEPLAYGGWIRALVAQEVDDAQDRDRLVEQSLARLDRAIAADDEYEDAYVFKGLVLLNLADDPDAAIPMLQRFLALAPQEHPQRQLVLDALERAVDTTSETTTNTTP